ncbi:phage antirepressor N-terminal domain-containing protein [Oceanospirillum maris]|uniref:phage antirepressor N-terminal domain-containing protein n=1 Tax=Oceanospirillum maris TaxID=64977 RepID=UPI000415880A|nr:phage antirepressor N-terminal domain-containing protein [Oceanospirillum maris]
MAAQIKTVPFHGQDLAVIPHEDKLLVAIKPICENIGVLWEPQRKRIQRNEVLSEGASMMEVPSKGGYQETVCLPLELLNGWLFGIDTSRIKNPEVKARVTEYQRECYQALFNYWTQGEAVNPRKRKKTQQPPKLGCLTKEQQTGIKEMVHYRVDALPQEKRAKAAITCWSALKSKFGCSYKEIATEHYTEAVSLVARLPLEGDYLPASESKPKPTPQAVFKAKRTPSDFDRRHGLLSPEQMFDCGWRVDLLWAVKWLKEHEGQTVKLESGLTDQLTLELNSILHWYESYRNKLMDIRRLAV